MKNYCPICQMFAWYEDTTICDYCKGKLVEPPPVPKGWPFPSNPIKKDES